ncbi:unnamed protein product, partial [Ranitomeya imitator]
MSIPLMRLLMQSLTHIKEQASAAEVEGSLDDSQPLSAQGSLLDEVADEEEEEEDDGDEYLWEEDASQGAIETGGVARYRHTKRRCSDTDNDPDRCSVAVWSLQSCHTDSSPATNDPEVPGNQGKHRDTTIALQAMAKYAKVIYRKKGDLTITIRSKSGFEKIVHVDKDNSLSVQKVNLPEIPGEYTVSATGKGFVYFQSHLHCNVLPKESEKGYFSFNVSTEPSHWTHASKKEFNIHVDVGYLGRRENTNMALIIVTMVSGYVPDRESVNK